MEAACEEKYFNQSERKVQLSLNSLTSSSFSKILILFDAVLRFSNSIWKDSKHKSRLAGNEKSAKTEAIT